MKNTLTNAVFGTMMALATAGAADAAVVMIGDSTAGVQVADRITTSTTWTANNVYRLQDQIFVEIGATLTIEPGTVIASTTGLGGSLAICRGAKIFVNGTCTDPVIMTSTSDVATWAVLAGHPTGRNPKTGTWRAAATEWGNLSIMGYGYHSNSPGQPHCGAGCTNVAAPNAANVTVMEGLTTGGGDRLYGGGNDEDDSGSIRYLSLRYGGKVAAINTELNGLSLGGVGRATDVDHIDIMNNVDDGIEVWGGTVNLKYVNIWYVGDDSFDLDQGWRGKAQFGLIVSGYSAVAGIGSGTGENVFEVDGAEDSDAQPVTTTTIYNFTVVGQPLHATNRGTAWRDGARVQYRNCVFMDLGNALVDDQNAADGCHGYGFNGTLSFAATWTTNWNVTSLINPFANRAVAYQAQTSGKLSEIKDSVFWRNLHAAAYTESDGVGVTIAGGSAPAQNNVVSAYVPATPTLNQPIVALTRIATDDDVDGNPGVTSGGTFQLRVTSIDPRAANAAVSSVAAAPNDGFFTPASYRGGFSSTKNWLCNWTAADAYGMVAHPGSSCVTCCTADIVGNGIVNVDDLLLVINSWGPCAGCAADITGNGVVNVDDLLAVINGWGACP